MIYSYLLLYSLLECSVALDFSIYRKNERKIAKLNKVAINIVKTSLIFDAIKNKIDF